MRLRVKDVDFTRFIYLTDITQNERRTEAFLYDRYNNLRTRLRASAGFDSFRFLDSKGEPLVRGEVARINDREVIIRFQPDRENSITRLGRNKDQWLGVRRPEREGTHLQ